MKTLKIVLRLLRSCLLGLLIAYWVIFIFYTVEKSITGGSSAVVAWYKHIDSSVVQRGDGWFLTKWSWEKFLVRQFAILAITLALYFIARRSKRIQRNQYD
jgi:phosphotransferase system  glucose/maltose/N-acetylglucosamine-specific IIC component